MRLGRILFYVRDVEETADFLRKALWFQSLQARKAIELLSWWVRGTNLMLHQAGKAQKTGQSTVKLVFDAENVEAFSEK